MPPRPALCLIVVGSLLSTCVPNCLGAAPGTLRWVQQVRCLDYEEAKLERRVNVKGVVTHVNPLIDDFFIQDATAGIYVHPTPLAVGLTQGDEIELEGTTSPGDFSPCITASKITRLGSGKLPDPFPFNMTVEDSRWLDGQWVQVCAVVRAVRTDSKGVKLEVYTSQGAGVAIVPGQNWANEAKLLKDRAVTLRGVCVPTFANRMVSGAPKILLEGLPRALSLSSESAREPEAPLHMIDNLLSFSPTPHPGGRRVKVAGVVTANPLPGVVVVQDESGGAFVWTSPPRNDIAIGDRIESYGLLRIDGGRISLTHAHAKSLGRAPLPTAHPVNAMELASGMQNGLMVRLDARIESVSSLPGWSAAVLVEGGTRFEAYLRVERELNPLESLEPGSRVSVAGVPMYASPDGKAGNSPRLFLPTAESVSLLEPPPAQLPPSIERSWWSPSRVAYLSGGFLAVSLCGGGWLLILRHQVRKAAEVVKQQYEEKAKLERQLRQAAKLEAVGRLAGGIAHDFNNLLTVINGCAELLVDESSLGGSRISELAEDIRRAGDRAAALTGQLLTFSRKREVPIAAVDLNDVVSDAVRLLDRVIGENISIETDLAPDVPLVCGEAGLIHQVVMNLAVNAKDAMPEGGTLKFTTSRIVEPVVNPPHHRSGSTVSFRHFVRLTVRDSGMGMSDEVKARIFEPFFTTKEVGTGTGLGLATVYGVIQTVRGRIKVDSAVGRGTTFHIDLRVHGKSNSDADFALASPTPLPTRRLLGSSKLAGRTILVVEDNDMVRDLLVSALSTDGATVLAAENPERALRILSDYPSPVDAMVTDVVMPGMSGRKLADRVRLMRPSLHIVFMSGYTADEVLREGVLADEVEFLQKPFTPDALTSRLLGILEQPSTK